MANTINSIDDEQKALKVLNDNEWVFYDYPNMYDPYYCIRDTSKLWAIRVFKPENVIYFKHTNCEDAIFRFCPVTVGIIFKKQLYHPVLAKIEEIVENIQNKELAEKEACRQKIINNI